MQEITLKANKRTPTPKIMEVYLMVAERSDIVDILFNKGSADYSRMFGFTDSVSHVALRFGSYIYEVKARGTTKEPWDESILENERIVSFFSADISKFSQDKINACVFVLENMVGRNLDIVGCLKYLRESIGFHKSYRELDRMAFTSCHSQVALPPSSYAHGKNPMFHLPFTCTTPVIAVLNLLIGYEPCFNNHLAQSTAVSLAAIADMGFGELYYEYI